MLQRVGEAIGRVIGVVLAPMAAAAARARKGRALHPKGIVCAADVVAAAEDPVLVPLAQRLAGGAIVRMSGALWRKADLPEMLGCAVRLRGPRTLIPEVDPEDQDLFFATARRAIAIPLATLTTDHDDYLHNVYYTIGWLDAPDIGQVELRLVPLPTAVRKQEKRGQRLRSAMEAGQARLRLEARRDSGDGAWQALCEMRLRGRLKIDARELTYSPFQNGQELRPRGFLHALRGPAYAAAQAPRTHE